MQTFNVKLARYYNKLIKIADSRSCFQWTTRHKVRRVARYTVWNNCSEKTHTTNIKSCYLTVNYDKSFFFFVSRLRDGARYTNRLAESLSPMRFPIPYPFRKRHKLLTIVWWNRMLPSLPLAIIKVTCV